MHAPFHWKLMPTATFAAEFAAYGPDRVAGQTCSIAEARAYCRRLAHTHYENFAVASWLLPRDLRPHFHAVYAYCRWADDLADEMGDRQQSLEMLDWWEEQVHDCYAGRVRHPVFVALQETIAEFSIPRQPLLDLLVAFRQDQHQTRYEDFPQLLQYCRYSANPVGRLVLYLGRVHDDERGRLADHVCTGLQLANFWQDVARDWDRGRIYLPQTTCRQFGYDEAMFGRREANAAFRSALELEVVRAEMFLRAGLPLVDLMPGKLRGDVWLFIQGGLKILAHVRRQAFDVWSHRPEVSKAEQFGLLLGCLLRSRGGRRTP
jgi:squalene synthase HpnC